MGWLVMAVGLTILIITGSYQNQKMSETTNAQQYASASVWASQILMIANRINDIRYVSGQQDGVISSDKLALPVTPDSRIKHQLQQGRLWVWMPEQPGLVETLRSKSRGSALIGIFQNGQLTWLSASSSTLTVTDTPAVQEAVARYVDEQNSIMNRQVALNVQVLSVSNTRNEQFGLDWNLVYKSLHSAGATLNNASGDFTGATSAGVSILDTATGNAAKFSGSSLLIKALSEQGDVSVVTSQESTVTNLTPVPIQMADQTVYVAQSATTTTTDVGATTTLTPGTRLMPCMFSR